MIVFIDNRWSQPLPR